MTSQGGNAWKSYGIDAPLTINSNGSLTATGNTRAITGNVKNYDIGTGWTNVAGTEGIATIEKNTDGRKLFSYRKVQFPEEAHNHSWTYTDSGATIIATCISGCPDQHDDDNKITLTLVAQQNLTYDGNAKAANITGYPTTVPSNLATEPTTITYYSSTGEGSTEIGGSALSSAPTDVGHYVAQMTWGLKTARVAFSISPATLTDVSVVQNGTLTYSGTEQTPQVTTAAIAVNNQTVTFTYSKTQDGYGNMPIVMNVSDGGTFYYKASAPNHSDYTGSFTVTISPEQETTPADQAAALAQLNIDYQDENISSKEGYKLAADNTGTEITNFSSILDCATPIVYVCKAASDANHSDSDWVEVTLAARPDAPELGSTKATSASSADGTITGVHNTMEYSSNGTNWNDVTDITITGLIPGSYYVRVKATDNAPHGIEATVTVGNKEEITLTDDQKPTAKTDLVFTGSDQQLVNAPVVPLTNGAEMHYALGTDFTTAPTTGWSTSIPTGKDVGEYFVWYKIIGSANYNDTEPVCLTVEIAFTVTFDPNGGSGNMNQVRIMGIYKLPANEFTPPEGHVFAHWIIGETPQQANDQIIVKSNLTVKAVWITTEEGMASKLVKVEAKPLADNADIPEEWRSLNLTVQEMSNALYAKLFAIGSAISQNQTKLYDVELVVSNDGGKTWVPATIDNFPTAGLEVLLGYPEGTGPNGWVFGVSHMFTHTVPRLGTTAGAVETPLVTKTSDGLRVKLKGLSPVMISWQKEEVAADPNSLPQTGDKSNVLIYALVGVLAIAGLGIVKRKRA